MPDLRAHGAWINPTALPITSSNFHAVHALKRTHTHTHSPTLSLPPLPPSASPRYSWERTGASQTGDGRQGGRHSTQSDPRRRPSRIGPRHTRKNTHEQIWRDWVSHAHTHTHTLKKAWNKTFHPACCWWQLFYFWYCDFYPVISIAF